jgi:hypothetical protein
VQDVFKPESQKLRRNLSAIVNFAKFREEKALAFQELQVSARRDYTPQLTSPYRISKYTKWLLLLLRGPPLGEMKKAALSLCCPCPHTYRMVVQHMLHAPPSFHVLWGPMLTVPCNPCSLPQGQLDEMVDSTRSLEEEHAKNVSCKDGRRGAEESGQQHQSWFHGVSANCAMWPASGYSH